jgi:hypothetical protein
MGACRLARRDVYIAGRAAFTAQAKEARPYTVDWHTGDGKAGSDDGGIVGCGGVRWGIFIA